VSENSKATMPAVIAAFYKYCSDFNPSCKGHVHLWRFYESGNAVLKEWGPNRAGFLLNTL
jgi:hypothetical protein